MHVASRSLKVRGGITAAAIVEGLAVTIVTSGVVNAIETDLPIIELADSGVNPVYIIAAASDNYDRPVDIRQYRAGWKVTDDRMSANGYSDPIDTGNTYYKVGLSNLYNPTIPSGVLVNAHRGGTYTVPSTVYVDSVGIKVPGNKIEVGTNGKWQYTTVATNAVGEVVVYRADTQELTFELYV